MADPYERGRNDYLNGAASAENPYTYGSPSWEDWEEGWKEAKSED